MNSYNFIPENHDTGLRIDKYLSNKLEDISRSKIKALIETGHLTNHSQMISNCSYLVKLGDIYEIRVPAAAPSELTPSDIPLNIIYEDKDLIVINKPAGLTVHPGSGNRDHTLVNGLLFHYQNNLSLVGGLERPGIVHRLDKDTSGLMVVAKNDVAHNFLSAQLSSRELTRIYSALIWGVPNLANSTITTNIARNTKDRLKMAVVKTGGRVAVTHYKIIENYNNVISQIECKLATGRTHQIRVHMNHIKHPVIGDQTYGKKINNKNIPLEVNNFPRQALHAKKIGFIHPTTKKYLEWEIDLPKDIADLISIL